MSTLAFLLPVPSRCLNPNPTARPRPFAIGDRVAWVDGEEGTVENVTKHSVSIFWDLSPYCVYCRTSGAMDRITILETEAA